jgi:hypothetical protein
MRLIGDVVSLVSMNVKAPLSTANGELVSDVTCASANTCAVSSALVLEVTGGVITVLAADPPLLLPHPTAISAAPIAANMNILDVIAYSSFNGWRFIQSFALVGEPASGVFKYGNAGR